MKLASRFRLAMAGTALALLASMIATPSGLAVRQLPAFFYGTVTVTGPEGSVPAIPGSTISATSGGASVTPDTVAVGLGGRFGGPNGSDDKLLVQDTPTKSLSNGDIIVFHDNGVRANETSTFESGELKAVTLTVVDSEGPTPPASPSQVTAQNVNLPAFSWQGSADRLSGVASYAVRIDGAAWKWIGVTLQWTATDTVSDGDHTFEVKSKDGVGNQGSPVSLSFKIDSRIPAIINPAVSAIGQNSAIITWTTNKPALSWLDLGLTAGNYVPAWTRVVADSPATTHAITLTGLVEKTTYHFRIRVKDNLGQEAISGDLFFATLAPPGPGSIPLGGGATTPPPTTAPSAPTSKPVQTTSTPSETTPSGQSTQPASTAPVQGQKLIDDKGEILFSFPLSPDKGVKLDIAAGTKAIDAFGKPLVQVQALPLSTPPTLPDGVVLVAYDFQPDGASFSPPAPMTFSFDQVSIPRGYTRDSLRIAYFDTATSSWVVLPGVVDASGKTISTLVNKFAVYALVVQKEPASGTPTAPGERPTGIDPLLERALYVGAGLVAFIASLVALVVILRMRQKKV